MDNEVTEETKEVAGGQLPPWSERLKGLTVVTDGGEPRQLEPAELETLGAEIDEVRSTLDIVAFSQMIRVANVLEAWAIKSIMDMDDVSEPARELLVGSVLNDVIDPKQPFTNPCDYRKIRATRPFMLEWLRDQYGVLLPEVQERTGKAIVLEAAKKQDLRVLPDDDGLDLLGPEGEDAGKPVEDVPND